MTGLVLSIERCSLNDGPGVRTAVFLKGCPLRCAWCHNPESQETKPELFFYGQRCSSCGSCARACGNRCHGFADNRHEIDRSACASCGKCVASCPSKALEIKGMRMDAEAILGIVEKDRRYFAPDGGLTLTGGEPLLQADFSQALLETAKRRGIHTCVETCGFAPTDRIAELATVTDLFLFDYKATDPSEHKRLTGVDNRLVMENLRFLAEKGKEIILRCPLVAGVNDGDGHLEAIAGLSKRYPAIRRVEVMAYHDMGVSKSRSLGRKPELDGIATTVEQTKQDWIAKLDGFGCRGARLG